MSEINVQNTAEPTASQTKHTFSFTSPYTGPGCRCPLQFTGKQCEEEVDVAVAGFVGHSLLVHRTGRGNVTLEEEPFQMMVSFKTSSSDGVLFHAEGINRPEWKFMIWPL